MKLLSSRDKDEKLYTSPIRVVRKEADFSGAGKGKLVEKNLDPVEIGERLRRVDSWSPDNLVEDLSDEDFYGRPSGFGTRFGENEVEESSYRRPMEKTSFDKIIRESAENARNTFTGIVIKAIEKVVKTHGLSSDWYENVEEREFVAEKVAEDYEDLGLGNSEQILRIITQEYF